MAWHLVQLGKGRLLAQPPLHLCCIPTRKPAPVCRGLKSLGIGWQVPGGLHLPFPQGALPAGRYVGTRHHLRQHVLSQPLDCTSTAHQSLQHGCDMPSSPHCPDTTSAEQLQSVHDQPAVHMLSLWPKRNRLYADTASISCTGCTLLKTVPEYESACTVARKLATVCGT